MEIKCFYCGKPIQTYGADSLLVKREGGGYFPEWFHYPYCSEEYKKKVRRG